MPWWLWVFVGVLALAGESISMALFLLYVGVAAFIAALLAVAHTDVLVQVGVFLALSVLLIGLVRPRMVQALTGRVPSRALTNQGKMAERIALVTQTVTPDGGMIRVGNAEFWTARTSIPRQRIEVGSPVRVTYVDGLTAYVEPMTVSAEASLASGVSPAPELAREER